MTANCLKGLTETWLSDGEDLRAYDMHSYIAVHVPRMRTNCSVGISLSIKSEIKFSRCPDLESLFTSVVSDSKTVYSFAIALKHQFVCDTVWLFYKPPPFLTHLFCHLHFARFYCNMLDQLLLLYILDQVMNLIIFLLHFLLLGYFL